MRTRRPWLALPLLATLALHGCGSESAVTPPDPCSLATENIVPDVGTPGVLYTWVGNGINGYDGGDKPRLQSSLSWPVDLTFLSDGSAVIPDWNTHVVRHVQPDGTLRTIVGQVGIPGDGGPSEYYPPLYDTANRLPADETRLNHPTHVLELPDGTLLISAWHNHKLRRYWPGTEETMVVCGRGPGYSGDGQPHTGALFRQPSVTLLRGDDLYVLDHKNMVIRRIVDFVNDPDAVIELVAGQPTVAGYGGDGGSALGATFAFDSGASVDANRSRGGMAFDDANGLYVADTMNHAIRRIDLGTGDIALVAGSPGVPGYVEGDALASGLLNRPRDIEWGPDGKLYIADEQNHAVRVYDPVAGELSTVAGRGEPNGPSGCAIPTSEEIGDGQLATEAYISEPTGLAFDEAGRLYIADYGHQRIRRMVLGG